jgi:hypothetical protein
VTPSSGTLKFLAKTPRGSYDQSCAPLIRLVQSTVPVLKQRAPLSVRRAAAFKNSQWRGDLDQSARRTEPHRVRPRGVATLDVLPFDPRGLESRGQNYWPPTPSLSVSLLCVCVCVCVCVCPVSLRGRPEKQNSRGEKREYVGVCLLVEALLG